MVGVGVAVRGVAVALAGASVPPLRAVGLTVGVGVPGPLPGCAHPPSATTITATNHNVAYRAVEANRPPPPAS